MKETAGVVAATAGALLVVALLLPWWGNPPVLLDPPVGAPEEIAFAAEAFEQNGTELEEDAFRFFGIKDLVWLLTGLVGFGFGLVLLVRRASTPGAGVAVAGLALASTALIAMVIASPPDYYEIGAAEAGVELRGDFEAPFGREPGPFVALAASLALALAAAASALRRSTDR